MAACSSENAQRTASRIIYNFLIKARTNLRLTFIISLSIIETFLNIGRTLIGDSHRYVNLALFFLGQRQSLVDTAYTQIVVMRPMVPLLASPLILVLNNARWSFGLISGIFWVGGAIIAYKLGLVFLEDEDLATTVALLYVFAPPLLIYGSGVMTESAGFFFIGLAVYLTLKREKQPEAGSETYFLEAFIIGLGVLFRETVLFALTFMIIKRLAKRKGRLATFLGVALVGLIEFAFLSSIGFGFDIYVYKYSLATRIHTHPLDWGAIPYMASLFRAFVTNAVLPEAYFGSFTFWIWTLPALLLSLFVAVGFKFNTKKKDLILLTLLLFPSTIVWPAMIARFTFSVWPVIFIAMACGGYQFFSMLPYLAYRGRIVFSPKICVFLFVLLLGLINTVDTLVQYSSLTVTL